MKLLAQSPARKYARRVLKRIRGLLAGPELKYLETHLVGHCNLACKGCGHFAPLVDKWFAFVKDHENDMRQLSRMFSNISRIRLMGGEPLEALPFV